MTDVSIEPIEPNDEDMAKNQVRFNIITNPPLPSEVGNYIAGKVAPNPCVYLGHRPAHRVDGGVECYDCGAQFT